MNLNLQLNIIYEKPLIAKLICLLFLVLILFTLFSSLYDFKNIFSDSMKDNQSLVTINDKSVKELVKHGLDVEIFGKYVPKQLGDANIRPSILNVKLIGVMFSPDKKNSQVILRLANGIERVFKIGDTIPGCAKILHISEDGIVVNRDGVMERVNLPTDKLNFDQPLNATNLFD